MTPTAPKIQFFAPGIPAPGGSKQRGCPKKASDEQIAESYSRNQSMKKVADEFGMCPQSVHARVKRLGLKVNANPLSDEEKAAIRELYAAGFEAGDGKLDGLSARFNRSIATIYSWASDNGLCQANRKKGERVRQGLGDICRETTKRKQAAGTYVNSQKGAKISEGRKMMASWYSKAKWASMTPDQRSAHTLKGMRTKAAKGILGPRPQKTGVSWKAGWREIGGNRIYFRSRWEFNYAVYLQFLLENSRILKWEHEPETFWFEGIKRGCVSYLPDFRVTLVEGKTEFHEVKGWMDPKSRTKIKRMKKYHPSVVLRIIDAKWFKANTPKISFLPGWEK